MLSKWPGCLLAALAGGTLPVASFAAQPVGAQPPAMVVPPPAALAAASCVVHVWPGASARSSYSGWFHGGAVDGDKRGIKGYPAMHADVLNTAAQRALLQSVAWPTPDREQAPTIIVHDAPPESQDHRTRQTPLIAGPTDCYDEVIVQSVMVESAVFSSSTVRVMAIAKRWRPNRTWPATYTGMASEKVNYKDPAAADGSLKQGYSGAITRVLSSEHFFRQ